MLVASGIVGAAVIAILPLIELLSKITNLLWAAVFSVLLFPVHVFGLPAVTRLERQLEFRRLVIIELSAQLIGLSVGVGLTVMGFGIWGPLTGWGIREACTAAFSWWAVRLLPRLHWSNRLALGIVKYGLRYTLATSLAQSRGFFLLTAIGQFYGQESVAYMALATRAINLISPLRAAAARVMLPTLASVSSQPRRLGRIVAAATEGELLLTIPVLITATWLFEPAIQLVLGAAWLPAASYFPWVAAGAIITATHGSSLTALSANGKFIESSATSLAICSAYFLILYVLANLKIEPCVICLFLAWPAVWLQELFCHRLFGTQVRWRSLTWAAAGVLACLALQYNLLLLIFSILVFYFTRKEIYSVINTMRT
jgi:O-antigen/teichoic acid export membrane protein